MNTKYSDLINQTYYFPQDEFTLNKDNLKFHIDLMKLIGRIWYPIKIHLFTSNFKQHQQGQNWFRKSMEKINMRQNIIITIVTPILNSL
jgi:arginine decarboxylase